MDTWILPLGITEQDVLKYQGFTYLITNLITGQKYIGKKVIHFTRKKKVKGKAKRIKYESDWRTYTGSCAELNDDIQTLGASNFRKEILKLHATKSAMNYHEIELQIQNNVLRATDSAGNYEYYNANILRRYFRNNIGK
ncbi:NAD synthetase (plasmid) [Komagataeibacter medellinensis]|uniref:NAD synthetase n=1 Tax=Komagataeibacter medellinensis TaxID=1177712 RepID=A0ABQ6VQR8_9PROT|nr:NAD synthetase [Komagataeibacter medellinensis]KAB8122224.1 NAD synthetase [Komagataeibacter medellinensis]